MRKSEPIKMKQIAEWSQDSERKDRHTVAAAFVLNNLFGTWCRVSAASQKLVFGFTPFGKAKICINNDGIAAVRKVCFGTDFSTLNMSWTEVEKMIADKRKPVF